MGVYGFSLFNRTTLQVVVTHLTGALYVHPLWFYKHQHDKGVRFKLFVACQRWWFQWRSDSYLQLRDTHAPCILKLCVPPLNRIVLWRLFPEFAAELPLDNCTPTIILNNPVYIYIYIYIYMPVPMAARSKAYVCGRSLRSWVRIPPGAWKFVCCECCVLSGRGLCDELITRPEESYRPRCVVVCDLETSRMKRSWPALGRSATGRRIYIYESLVGNWLGLATTLNSKSLVHSLSTHQPSKCTHYFHTK